MLTARTPRARRAPADDDVETAVVPGAEPPRLRTRRSPVLIVAGLLCAVLGALGGAFAWTQASRAQSVLVMTRDVARGEQLRSGDLGVVSISVAEGVSTSPAADLDRLLGRHARVDLPAGSLPGAGSIGALPVSPGTAQVGLRLPVGRVPTSPMPAGTRISVVEVAEKSGTQTGSAIGATSSATDAENSPRSTDAVVVRAPVRAEDRASWLLDVEVGAGQAARLADLAARDRVAVIVRGP